MRAKGAVREPPADGQNSGNSRNGKYTRRVRSSSGKTEIAVRRDRNGEFESKLLKKYETSLSEPGREVGDGRIRGNGSNAVTDKVLPLVEAWQSRPLADTYAPVYLDALNVKLRRDSRVEKTAVYIVLGVEGHPTKRAWWGPRIGRP